MKPFYLLGRRTWLALLLAGAVHTSSLAQTNTSGANQTNTSGAEIAYKLFLFESILDGTNEIRIYWEASLAPKKIIDIQKEKEADETYYDQEIAKIDKEITSYKKAIVEKREKKSSDSLEALQIQSDIKAYQQYQSEGEAHKLYLENQKENRLAEYDKIVSGENELYKRQNDGKYQYTGDSNTYVIPRVGEILSKFYDYKSYEFYDYKNYKPPVIKNSHFPGAIEASDYDYIVKLIEGVSSGTLDEAEQYDLIKKISSVATLLKYRKYQSETLTAIGYVADLYKGDSKPDGTSNKALRISSLPSSASATLPSGPVVDGDKAGTSAEKKSFGFSQSDILFALADFMIKRANEELKASFIELLGKAFDPEGGVCIPINISDTIYMKDLFPEFLEEISNTPILYSRNNLPALQTALIEDFLTLPQRFGTAEAASALGKLRKELLKDSPALIAGLWLAGEFSQGKAPIPVLAGMEDFLTNTQEIKDVEDDLRRILHLISRVAQAYEFLHNHTAEIDGTVQRLEGYLLSPGKRDLLFTALASELPGDLKMDATRAQEFMQLAFSAMQELLAAYQAQSEALRNSTTPEAKLDVAAGTLKAVNRFLDTVLKAYATYAKENEQEPEALRKKMNQFTEHIQTGITLTQHVLGRNYPAAVNSVADILSDVLPSDSKTAKAVHASMSFLGNFAAAQTSDDRVAVIEAFAQPVGGYKAKRIVDPIHNYRFHYTINSYLGAFGGMEKITENNTGTVGSKYKFIPGLYAPIGFEVSWALGEFKKNKSGVKKQGDPKGGSLSVFLPVIDLGALVSFRLTSETNASDTTTTTLQTDPNINFENVFAPGAYLVWGMGVKSAFSFGVGFNFTPKLRKVTVEDTTDPDAVPATLSVSAIRFGAFLAIDIPIITLGRGRGGKGKSKD